MAADSPHIISVQRIATFQCSLGVLAAIQVKASAYLFDMRTFRSMT